MTGYREAGRRIFSGAVFFLILCIVMTNGKAVSGGMKSAVMVCIDTMIPSLYAMMILSRIFTGCGFNNSTGRMLKAPAKYIFGCSGELLAVFIFSQAAGYPVGSTMILDTDRKNQLTPAQAGLLSGVCFGCGPVFTASLFGRGSRDALAVTAAYMLANLILFAVFVRFIKFTPQDNKKEKTLRGGFSHIITSQTAESGRALLRICAVIVMFGGIAGLISDIPFVQESAHGTAGKFLFALMEISHVTELFPYSTDTLPLIGAAVSFGGICVIMQIAAISEGRINIPVLCLTRIAASLLTWGFLTVYGMILPRRYDTAAVIFSGEYAGFSHSSPVPSVLLLIMTFMLLLTAEKNRRTL